jgi:hypothetical protein
MHIVLDGAGDQSVGADDRLDPTYQEVVAGLKSKLTLDDDPSRTIVDFRRAQDASLRQIGHEVLNSPEVLGLR